MFRSVIVVKTALGFLEYHRQVTSGISDDLETLYSAVVASVVLDAVIIE